MLHSDMVIGIVVAWPSKQTGQDTLINPSFSWLLPQNEYMIWNRFDQWVSEMRGRQDFTYILAIERPSVRLFPLLQAGSVVYTWCWCGGGWVVEWKCSGAWLGHVVNCVQRDLVKLIETCFHFIPGLTQWTTEGNVATKRRQVSGQTRQLGWLWSEWEVRCVMRCRLRGSSRVISKEGVKHG